MALGPFGYSEEVLTALPYGCLLVDREGTIQAVNPAALRLLGCETGRLIRRPLFEAVPAWDESDLKRSLPSLWEGRGPQPDVFFELPGAQGRWLHVRAHLIFPDPARQEYRRLLLVLADATEWVELKERLRRTEYHASIGKLARGIAHELNNPLDGVLRYTHLALEQISDETPVREYLLHVKEGLDRMVRATKAFLEFSRQASTPIQRTSDLNKVAEEALLLIRHRAKFQQVRVVTHLDGGLPSVRDGGLQHAVANLVRNAFDAMPRGGTLTLSTECASNQVLLQVEDTGCGMSQEVQERIFEPFFTTKPSHKGSGLGLVIAKEVVERSGGRLEFESRSGVGSCFRIHLPVMQEDPMTPSALEGANGA